MALLIFISMGAPIDQAMSYFKAIAFLFSVMTLSSIVGIAFVLIGEGFYPPVKEYLESRNADGELNGDWSWVTKEDEGPYFSWLTLAGTVMLSVYLVPIVLRPLDFYYNMSKYLVGMMAYFMLLPIYINVMQVYAMSNLHDLSWGNRPSATAGTDAISANAKKQ